MLWAAFLVCFFGFMRSGEICTQGENWDEEAAELAYHNIAVDDLANPTRIQVRLKKSKTDVFRQGTVIHLGRTGDELCLVAALRSWMIARGAQPAHYFILHQGVPSLVRYLSPSSGKHSHRQGYIQRAIPATVFGRVPQPQLLSKGSVIPTSRT